jgi:hypothetical protein
LLRFINSSILSSHSFIKKIEAYNLKPKKKRKRKRENAAKKKFAKLFFKCRIIFIYRAHVEAALSSMHRNEAAAGAFRQCTGMRLQQAHSGKQKLMN